MRAMRRVFGEHRPAYSSTKGYTGHSVSGAGAIEAIFTLAMLRCGFIAPCPNAEPVDPELADWPPVTAPVSRPLRVALLDGQGALHTREVLRHEAAERGRCLGVRLEPRPGRVAQPDVGERCRVEPEDQVLGDLVRARLPHRQQRGEVRLDVVGQQLAAGRVHEAECGRPHDRVRQIVAVDER